MPCVGNVGGNAQFNVLVLEIHTNGPLKECYEYHCFINTLPRPHGSFVGVTFYQEFIRECTTLIGLGKNMNQVQSIRHKGKI
jgi:hypothetical protein